ncbi:unnamed protein product, partial [marine sediment metagenome]
DCSRFIRENYPEYYEIYQEIETPVQKADLWRYLIIYHYGGWYCDMDIYGYWSFGDINIPRKYGDRKDLLIVEKENPVPFRSGKTCPRLPQYAQYWFGATPKHPVLLKVIQRVVRQLKYKEDFRREGDEETLYLTGPVPFTDAIQKYMNHDVLVLESNFFDAICQPLYYVSSLFAKLKNTPVVHRCDGSWRESESSHNTDVWAILIYTVILMGLLIFLLRWSTKL